MIEIKTIQQLFPRSKTLRPGRLLAVFAHPDDESLNIGGLLAKAKKEGIETYLVCLTKGEKGVVDPGVSGERLGKQRTKELNQAGEILGLTKIFTGGLPDGDLYNQQERIKQILEEIMVQIQPGVVITHDPSGGTGHPDHITASLAVKSVLSSSLTVKINLYFVVLEEKLRKMAKKSGQPKVNWRLMPEPTHCLDIASFAEVKAKACLAHQSQQPEQPQSIPLRVWYQLFDREYFHLIDLSKKYQFQNPGPNPSSTLECV